MLNPAVVMLLLRVPLLRYRLPQRLLHDCVSCSPVIMPLSYCAARLRIWVRREETVFTALACCAQRAPDNAYVLPAVDEPRAYQRLVVGCGIIVGFIVGIAGEKLDGPAAEYRNFEIHTQSAALIVAFFADTGRI